MSNILIDGYKRILGREPENLTDWQIAEEIIKNFDGRKFNEWEALKLLNETVNGVKYPGEDRTKAHTLVLQAEALFGEIIPEELRIKYHVGDEPHMDDMARVVEAERIYKEQEKELQENLPKENKIL